VANSLEPVLLLPQDMADLKSLKKHEVFLTLKRDRHGGCLSPYSHSYFQKLPLYFLRTFFTNSTFYSLLFVQVVQVAHVAGEWVDHAHSKLKDEEARCVFTIKA